MPPQSNILVYLVRRDLRLSDNPILHFLGARGDHGFTHLLPLYVFAAQQIEVSGFIPADGAASPYPEARSQVGHFWRCGPHRARFLAESVSDLQSSLEGVGSGLCIRVGLIPDVLAHLVQGLGHEDAKVGAVWMTSEEGVEEKREERDARRVCQDAGVSFKIWPDEKYLVDDRDLPFQNAQDLPDVFTTYRKMVEPLRERPRSVLPTPPRDSLPPFPSHVPTQKSPFVIPDTAKDLISALHRPLTRPDHPIIKEPPSYPSGSESAHAFTGGESNAYARLDHLLSSGAMTNYKETRNGLLGSDFSSKISAYLALGSITARQIHVCLLAFEDGTAPPIFLPPATSTSPSSPRWTTAPGFSHGENSGTQAMRFELLWRDYMRLCTRKFGPKLFSLTGFRSKDPATASRWLSPSTPGPDHTPCTIQTTIDRFLNGTTGMGLIDASQRELYHTGYTSNRARQNVASFLAKHLYIDWRIGAEWYECMLVDYDVSSNWGNWQYLAGTGNDPRGEARIFNPVKQAYEYDPRADYVKAWVQEVRGLGDPGECFQGWTVPDGRRAAVGLSGLVSVEKPLRRIEFTVGRRGNSGSRGRGGAGFGGRDGNRSRGRGGPSSGGGVERQAADRETTQRTAAPLVVTSTGPNPPVHGQNQGYQGRNQGYAGQGLGQGRGGYGGRGYGSSRGHLRGFYTRAQAPRGGSNAASAAAAAAAAAAGGGGGGAVGGASGPSGAGRQTTAPENRNRSAGQREGGAGGAGTSSGAGAA